MPLWKIYHPPTIFTLPSDKHALAQAITAFYTGVGLPAYYVNVQFWPVAPENFYTAGRAIATTIFIEILHIARHIAPGDKQRQLRVKDAFDEILRPWTADKGLHLEYTVAESSAGLWRINGVDPPEAFGEGEREQAEVNRRKLDEMRKHVG